MLLCLLFFFFFKQKTAYEMRISDWSSDVCSSDLPDEHRPWQVGVLYNQDDRGARFTIPLLEAEGLNVGDQEPYSGKLLNATMNRHAEELGRASCRERVCQYV